MQYEDCVHKHIYKMENTYLHESKCMAKKLGELKNNDLHESKCVS